MISLGLLQAVDEIGRQGNNVFSSVEKITREGEVDPHHPVFGLKRDIIRLLGNMSYRHRKNQDLVNIIIHFLKERLGRVVAKWYCV